MFDKCSKKQTKTNLQKIKIKNAGVLGENIGQMLKGP